MKPGQYDKPDDVLKAITDQMEMGHRPYIAVWDRRDNAIYEGLHLLAFDAQSKTLTVDFNKSQTPFRVFHLNDIKRLDVGY